MSETYVDLSHPALELALAYRPGTAGLRIARLAASGAEPMVSGGPAFGLDTAAGWYDGSDVTVLGHESFTRAAGARGQEAQVAQATTERQGQPALAREHVVRTVAGDSLAVDWHLVTYAGTTVVEMWPVVRNGGTRPVSVERLDSLVIDLPPNNYGLRSFSCAGSCTEFAPARRQLSGPHRLESLSGRSSHGDHPWFGVQAADGRHLIGMVAWSGNWVMRFDPVDSRGYRISGGLHDQGFRKDLQPGEELVGPRVVLALGQDDLFATAATVADIGRAHWYPPVDADFPPTEWNHWWPYVDHLDEATFRANVDAAADLGLELCTLDAGWYGPTDPAAPWYDYRGDWDTVNTHRFPSGIRALADHVHQRGMKFGLWCEIEGLGVKARLTNERPDLPAIRSGDHLGYVCFANPAGQAWATETLDRLITAYACELGQARLQRRPWPGMRPYRPRPRRR